MTDIPLYLPTSHGVLAAIATLPTRTTPREPAVVLLGGERGAARQRWQRPIAHGLSERGHAVLRFSYPGSGLSPSPEHIHGEDLVTAAHEVAVWFRDTTGLTSIGLMGSCRRGKTAIHIAAQEPSVTTVAAINPFVKPVNRSRETTERPIQDIRSFGLRADLHLIYGSEDVMYKQLIERRDAGDLEDVWNRLHLHILEDTRLHGFQKIEDYPWLHDTIITALSQPSLVER